MKNNIKKLVASAIVAAGIAIAALSIAKATEEEPAARTTWEWEVSSENDAEEPQFDVDSDGAVYYYGEEYELGIYGEDFLVLPDEEVPIW